MAVNDFIPFCPTTTGTNLPTQSAYIADPDRSIGNQPGLASSSLNNKALRQGTFVASCFAQFISDALNANVADNGIVADLVGQIKTVLTPFAPQVISYPTGAGFHNSTYYFFVGSASATAGATYTDGSSTFTIVTTAAASNQLRTRGDGVPGPSGTLTKVTGTGDASIPYSAVKAPLYSKVYAIGGGAGGSGGSGAGGANSAGTNGNSTTFGGIITAGGGQAPTLFTNNVFDGGVGGTAALTTSSSVFKIAAINGNGGGGSGDSAGTTVYFAPGQGGPGFFGGLAFGIGGASTTSPTSAAFDGSGAGGTGGGQSSGGGSSGAGGGAGAVVIAMILNPGTNYAYSVGTGGTGGIGTLSTGGIGAKGQVIVEEYFQ